MSGHISQKQPEFHLFAAISSASPAIQTPTFTLEGEYAAIALQVAPGFQNKMAAISILTKTSTPVA
jgi:hypothetical protein